MENPWWAFTAHHTTETEGTGADYEEGQEESIVDTETSDSEEELFTEIDDETCIAEVVTDETKVISRSEEDTLEIIDEVLNKVNEQSSTSNVTTDDEGIGSDNSYYEDTSLQTDTE